ncbi:MAG: TnsA endonuclease N-terminal domain-containing protein [Planctomycetales bacterium]|nr:TnsA endonuclease N-terminal domain-containing protein [Planctomycetales bacterium]
MSAKSVSAGPVDTENHTVSTFRLRRRTPGSFVLVPFPNGGRSIRCQGQLEAAAAVILANCPLVTAIQEQPLKIHYSWRGNTNPAEICLLEGPPAPGLRKTNQCSYIVPDFLVTMTDGRQRLIEVKPSSKLVRPDVQRKLCVARTFAEQQGWTFHVLTEVELRRGPLLSNLRLLSRYRRLVTDPEVLTILEGCVANGVSTFGDVLEQSSKSAHHTDARAALLHLIASGRLDVDLLSVPISDNSVLYNGGSISWEPFDSVWGPSGSSMDGASASFANLVPTNS